MDEKKVREAIEELKNFIYVRKRTLAALPNSTQETSYLNKEIEAVETAIEALEKQLPKKPKENGMNDGIFRKIKCHTCPACGNCRLTEMMNERQNTNYCWDCGQKLDWSE